MKDKKSSLEEGETKSLLYLHFISLGLVFFFFLKKSCLTQATAYKMPQNIICIRLESNVLIQGGN